jgi:DNA-directed RNA polymerase specialized sigma24 family protein
MSHRQIAQVLQVRKSAIKSLLFRAYEDLARTVGTISMKAANGAMVL